MPRLFSAKVILFLLFLAVLDSAILPVFQIHSIAPSFLYLFVCYAAFEWGGLKTIYAAFWAGLIRDFLGGGLLGAEATILTGLAFLLDFSVQKIEKQFPGIYFFITFLFIFLAGTLELLLACVGALPAGRIENYMSLVFFTALYTSALLPVFYFLTDRWFGRLDTKQYELFR